MNLLILRHAHISLAGRREMMLTRSSLGRSGSLSGSGSDIVFGCCCSGVLLSGRSGHAEECEAAHAAKLLDQGSRMLMKEDR